MFNCTYPAGEKQGRNASNVAKEGISSYNKGMIKSNIEDISIIIDKLKELKNRKEIFKAKKFLTPIQQGVFNTQNKPLWLYIWKLPDEVKCEHFTNCNIPIQYPRSKYGRFIVVDDKELKLYSENEKGEAKHKGTRVDLDEELLVIALKEKLQKERQQYWIDNIQPLIDEVDKLLSPFWDYLNANGSWGAGEQLRIETAIQAQDSTELDEVIRELDKVRYQVEKELNQKVVLQQCGIEQKSKFDRVPSGELIKILNDLVSEFKGQCFATRILCQKVTLPKGADADELIARIISSPTYRKEKYTSGEEDVYFVFYSLGDDSGLLTLFNITSRPMIGRAVNQLLLDKYDVSSIPDSVMFITSYPKLAAEDKTPFSEKEWSVVHWYEFLFKLGNERASLICPKRYDTRITDVKECWHLGSDVFDASMKALDYLLEKVKLLEQKEQSEPVKNKKRKTKTKIQNWNELSVDFIDDNTIRYKAGKKEWKKVSYIELGFKDKKKCLPNKPWEIFLTFAEVHHDGYIDFNISQSTSRREPYGETKKRAAFMKCKDRICKALKDYFGPQEPPIKYIEKEKRFRVEFTLSDSRPKKHNQS
jgi:hypothetical protein